jgi:NAD(P)-dependent dehydrogenase (short-subunit alcohol dehydrogenase family)
MSTERVAWVTGATGGLGPAIVHTLAESGAAIVATARTEAALVALQASVRVRDEHWLAAAADLSEPEAALAVVREAAARFGVIDILVHVTGGWRGGTPVSETALSVLDWLWRINLVTAFNACQAVLPQMTASGWGRIITIGARAAVNGQARSGAYAATKAALLALTQSIAAETRGSGVTANALLVSTIDTLSNRNAAPTADFRNWVTPEQIAAAVRFLCSEDASAISGAALPVYGRM